MNRLSRDLRLALRQARNNLAFTAVVVLTFAIGIGANSAVFSVVDEVLLKSLPYPEPDRLIRVFDLHDKPTTDSGMFSPQDFEDLKAQAKVFENLTAFEFLPGQTEMNLTGLGEPVRLEVAQVSGGFFPTLRATTNLGRTMTEADDQPGHNHVVVISSNLWRDRFDSDPGTVGRSIMLDGKSYTVIGVMPGNFQYPSDKAQVWVPLSIVPDSDTPHVRSVRWLNVMGRLIPGVTAEQAQANVETVLKGLAAQYPDSNKGWGTTKIVPLRESLVGSLRTALVASWLCSGLVFLLAVANISALMLARAVSQMREMSIRAAVGATRADLAVQRLVQSIFLGVLGGIAGVGFAVIAERGLTVFGTRALPQLANAQMNLRVIAFAFALSIVAGIAVGLAPMLRSSRQGTAISLHGVGRTQTESHQSKRLREILMVVEASLAVVLLVACGLLLRSLGALIKVDPGFATDHVLTLRIAIPAVFMDDLKTADEKTAEYRNKVITAIGEIPGVAAVGSSKIMPMEERGEAYRFEVVTDSGRVPVSTPSGLTMVTSGYFNALRIPLLQGSTFTAADDLDGRRVVVINEALASSLWPGQSAIGKKLYLGKYPFDVIGVVGNVHNDGLAAPVSAAVYGTSTIFPRGIVQIFVRTTQDPRAIVGQVRAAIRRVDPNEAVQDITTMRDVAAGQLSRPRFFAFLLSCFGGIAVFLAAIGLYGAVSYSVKQQTREIGVRIALGAQREHIVGIIVRRALLIAGCGLAVGIACAWIFSRLMNSMLYGVRPHDARTFLLAPLLMLLVAVTAAFLPARTAASVEPVTALRQE
ncbi:MAG TPA: ABC transporter permease [Terriglobales bacterium]|nr:ABC transporter permease [Terriglobales bacterium]